jgi:hypothetical protein
MGCHPKAYASKFPTTRNYTKESIRKRAEILEARLLDLVSTKPADGSLMFVASFWYRLSLAPPDPCADSVHPKRKNLASKSKITLQYFLYSINIFC